MFSSFFYFPLVFIRSFIILISVSSIVSNVVFCLLMFRHDRVRKQTVQKKEKREMKKKTNPKNGKHFLQQSAKLCAMHGFESTCTVDESKTTELSYTQCKYYERYMLCHIHDFSMRICCIEFLIWKPDILEIITKNRKRNAM